MFLDSAMNEQNLAQPQLSEDLEADQEKRLLATLNRTHGQAKTSVLVVGDGLNIQSSRLYGKSDSVQWNDILCSVWKDAGGDLVDFNKLVSSGLKWSALVDLRSQTDGIDSRRAEEKLKRTVCAHLERLEELEAGELYPDIVGAGFVHIVSFSVDRRIVSHVHPSRVEGTLAGGSFLHRRIRLKGAAGTSIWLPYGDLTDPKSIEIGYSSYDKRLMMLEDYRKSMMDQWYDWNISYTKYELNPPGHVYWHLWNSATSWYDLFFVAPLVFVGISLAADDWPLWWLLHQRARNFVPFLKNNFYDVPDTFFLTVKDADTSHLEGSPAGIELVKFASHDSMWGFLRRAIAHNGS
jgi:hypothetical protein